jgi:uncharacterized membrane protein
LQSLFPQPSHFSGIVFPLAAFKNPRARTGTDPAEQAALWLAAKQCPAGRCRYVSTFELRARIRRRLDSRSYRRGATMNRPSWKYVVTLGVVLLFPLAALATITFTLLSLPVADLSHDSAYSINDNGDVAGSFATNTDESNDIEHGFLLRSGVFTQYDVPGSHDTEVGAINNNGDFAGTFSDTGSQNFDHGFVVRNGKLKTFDVFNTCSFPDINGMNNDGDIVGAFDRTSKDCNNFFGTHAFFRSEEGGLTQFDIAGAVGTEAQGINDKLCIVGFWTDGSFNDHGFLIRNLKDVVLFDYPGATETDPYGINDAGVIVGSYVDSSDNTHGFLRTPEPNVTYTTIDEGTDIPTALRAINKHGNMAGFITEEETHSFTASGTP